MLLNEFFGKPADIGKKMSKDQDDQKLGDELFWYIVDHDRLHKEFFHPLATKIKKQQDGGKVDKEKTVLEFAPMVKKGCLEFFKSKKMKGHPEKIFNKELFKDMCEKLYDHYSQDIQKGQYTLGISESALTSPMRMQDFVRMADEIHAKMIDGPVTANLSNGKTLTWHKVEQGVAEGNLNELDMFAPVTTYVRLANGEYVAASWRRNQDLSGGNNASFIDIKPLAPNVAKQLGLDQRLNDPNKNYTGVASIASGGGVQSSTPFSDKTIDVVDIMDKKFAKDMGVPDAVFGKIAQWTQQQGVASNKQVPIGEHLEIQMSKFIGRIIANEAIQNNKHRS